MTAEKNYIPKKLLNNEFLKKYPEYDGRGIKIAIIDTDIADMSLPELKTTTIGLPKIIDSLDKPKITVDTSKIVLTMENNYIIGLSGRKLEIPSSWENISDKWHLGSISLKKSLDVKIAGKEYIKFEKELKNDNGRLLVSLKDEIIDCIVWFDGEKWRACVDTSFATNLDGVKVLKNFDDEHDVVINDLIFCVNIADDGNSIEIFSPLHYHGTVVTQVAAAYFPNDPESSGLAPGAQIVSLHWDNFEEALLKCMEHKVDIINFSCSFKFSTYAKYGRMFKELVEDYGIIITQYSRNDGPFYSSLAKNYLHISELVFIIGSIFTTDVKREFDYKERVNAVHNYSSKGPLLPSGARGIDFVAPGAAILDLPKWYPIKNARCQGTSLAAPNVAGSIACLLSALKANSIKYSPAMTKIALAKTAFLPEGADKLAYGNGIIQIMDAFEFIKKSINDLPLKSLMPISIDEPNQRGIVFYQNKYKLPQIYRYYVNIDPMLNVKWILKCTESGRKFITHYKTDNFFTVKIDASHLEEGSINYAEISGIDSSNPSLGPLFYLPITVICLVEFVSKEIKLKPGPPKHIFFKCPSEAQQCSMKITLLDKEESEITMEYCQKKNFRLMGTRQKHDNNFSRTYFLHGTSFIRIFVSIKKAVPFNQKQKCIKTIIAINEDVKNES